MIDLFPKVNKISRGYGEEAVAQFFQTARDAYESPAPDNEFTAEDIRLASFPLVRGGFNTNVVDGALSRLEAAFIQRDRSAFIAHNGETAWFDKIADEATTLYPRLLRPHGDRFNHPKDSSKGYSCEEVDALLDRLAAFFDDRDDITEADLRFALFNTARGKKAYEESQVDAFIGKANYVLLAVS